MKSNNISRGRERRPVGRPSLPSGQKRQKVSLSISRAALHQIDAERGALSRSAYFETIMRESRRELRKAVRLQQNHNGAVYTPKPLADYVAKKLVTNFLDSQSHSVVSNFGGSLARGNLKAIDPACGTGELLAALWNELVARTNGELATTSVARYDILCGMDIDLGAVAETRNRIRKLGVGKSRKDDSKILVGNALFPFDGQSSADGWKPIMSKLGAPLGFDLVIANPPWGASVSDYRSQLRTHEFKMFENQFDTSDLFLELAINILRPGGFFAFIVPDSLFSLDKKRLRELLLSETRICFLARLGEKIFPNINRACAVIVCQKNPSTTAAGVKCMRLTPNMRREILRGNMTFSQAEKALGHVVAIKRFASNMNFAFDIDASAKDEKVLIKFDTCKAHFADYLVGSRGVELSKSGRVSRCPKCRFWMPLPTTTDCRCSHCRFPFKITDTELKNIVSDFDGAGKAPLLVGESIGRYQIKPNLWIELGYEGVNYKKAETYSPPKILVRKTGVGVSASIDYSVGYTNQVVYIFRPNAINQTGIPLEFFLGVLNSRALYYFLVKRHGETEWRSHPYITQQHVLTIPLPAVAELTGRLSPQVARIAELVGSYVRTNQQMEPSVDAAIEFCVAQLFGLTRTDYRKIYDTLECVEDLLPVRALKRISADDIFAALG